MDGEREPEKKKFVVLWKKKGKKLRKKRIMPDYKTQITLNNFSVLLC